MKKKVLLFLGISFVLLFGAIFAYVSSVQYKVDTTDDNESVAEVDSGNRTVAYLNKDAQLSDIKKEKGKVNIYMFWGNGCPHCKAQWEYLEALRSEYPNDFNVYGFEVWYNKSNLELLTQFATAMGDGDVNSVPYTIIGDKSYEGAQSEATLTGAIKKYKDAGIDVYFDKINKM